mgnify:CR=1 FL=1
MRIGVNTRLLLNNKLEGIGRFTVESLQRICRSHPEHTFYFFFDRDYDDSFIFADNVIPVVVSPQARHPILWKIWFNWRLPALFKKHKIDIFLSPDGYLSKSTSIPQVNVIHDLNFVHQPDDVPGWAGKYLRSEFPLFAKKAKHILTVSEYSKQDLVKSYHLDPNKITVCYNGVGDQFEPKSSEKQIRIRNSYSEGRPYILYLGALHPRKNITRMLQAFDQFKEQNPGDTKFLLAGKKMWWTDEMEHQLKSMKHASDVIFSGHVPQSDLPAIYSAAECLLYVSYFEGFGIPMIESMKAGTPVLASNTSCLPEIAGDAVLFADPYSIEDITDKLNLLCNNKELAQELITKGLKRAETFTWDRTADIIWNTLEKVYAESL